MKTELSTCEDCGIDAHKINEWYMITYPVWDQVADRLEVLCIGCLENRLGRKLKPEDFADVPLNHPGVTNKSERLVNRLGDRFLNWTMEDYEKWEPSLWH